MHVISYQTFLMTIIQELKPSYFYLTWENGAILTFIYVCCSYVSDYTILLEIYVNIGPAIFPCLFLAF